MQDFFDKNVDGHRVSKIIYGSIIILVVILAMEDHPPSAAGTVATVLFAGLGVALAELYSDFIGTRIRERRGLTWNERSQITRNVSAVMIGAFLPMPFFILAWIGLMRLEVAIVFARWTLVGVLLFYGYVASKLSGYNNLWSMVSAVTVCTIGLLVVLIKSTVGH